MVKKLPEQTMHVTIPDNIASYLHEHWEDDFPRRVLESLALEAYRERLIRKLT